MRCLGRQANVTYTFKLDRVSTAVIWNHSFRSFLQNSCSNKVGEFPEASCGRTAGTKAITLLEKDLTLVCIRTKQQEKPTKNVREQWEMGKNGKRGSYLTWNAYY